MLFYFALGLHVVSAVVWVGGMFFAYVCLRPAVAPLTAQERTALWGRVLKQFFGWVLVAVPTMLLTGLWMVHMKGGFADVERFVAVMFSIGIVMMLLFLHVYFAPFRRLQRALAAGDTPAAARAVGQIRKLVAINLVLGLCVVLDATAGKFVFA